MSRATAASCSSWLHISIKALESSLAADLPISLGIARRIWREPLRRALVPTIPARSACVPSNKSRGSLPTPLSFPAPKPPPPPPAAALPPSVQRQAVMTHVASLVSFFLRLQGHISTEVASISCRGRRGRDVTRFPGNVT
jgi:hypothetical protein